VFALFFGAALYLVLVLWSCVGSCLFGPGVAWGTQPRRRRASSLGRKAKGWLRAAAGGGLPARESTVQPLNHRATQQLCRRADCTRSDPDGPDPHSFQLWATPPKHPTANSLSCGAALPSVCRMPLTPICVALCTALLAAAVHVVPVSAAFIPLPLRLPNDTGHRILQLRQYAADQCTTPVPRVAGGQLAMFGVARWESQYLEQWVRVGWLGMQLRPLTLRQRTKRWMQPCEPCNRHHCNVLCVSRGPGGRCCTTCSWAWT
jgi:hypothetical protein